MALSLKKGEKISLSKTAAANGSAGLKKLRVGLGWDVRATDGAEFDLDASAFLLKGDGKVRGDHDMVFYGQPESLEGAVKHTGDNKTGAGDGDDESVIIDLEKMPADVLRVAITATIHLAAKRAQSFGQVSNAYVRVLDEATGTELTRYDLSEDYSTETALIFGAVYLHNGEWKFEANGQGFAGGLKPLAMSYGVDVGDEE